MKRCMVLSLRVLSVCLFLSCLSTAHGVEFQSWKVGPIVDVHFGRATELVYDTSGIDNQNTYISKLDWDLFFVPTLGVEAEWSTDQLFQFSMRLSSAIPTMNAGEMNNYDWMFTDRDWSHWTVSEADLRWGFLIDIESMWRIVEKRTPSLSIGIAYHLDWWAWTDITKDSIYSDITEGAEYPVSFGTYPGDGFRDLPDYATVGVNAIDYNVSYHALLVQIEMGISIDQHSINFLFGIGPVFGASKDHHKLRDDWSPKGVYFYDYVLGFPWVESELTYGFRTNKNHEFLFGGSWCWMNESRGISIAENAETGAKYHMGSVAGMSYSDLSFFIQFVLFI